MFAASARAFQLLQIILIDIDSRHSAVEYLCQCHGLHAGTAADIEDRWSAWQLKAKRKRLQSEGIATRPLARQASLYIQEYFEKTWILLHSRFLRGVTFYERISGVRRVMDSPFF